MSRVQQIERWWLAALLGAAISGAPYADALAQTDVGKVVSVSGTVYAESPAGERRALNYGDEVREGDRVTVGAKGQLGVLSGEVYAQLASGSRVRFGTTAQGAPDLTLEQGKVRVVDTRTDAQAPRHRLATPHVEASGLGTDSEAYVLSERAGAYSMVCEWGEPLSVRRGDEALTAQAGECATAKGHEPLYTSRAHEERIPVAVRDVSEQPSALGALAERFSPIDVAAPPPATGLLAPAPPAFELEPCDTVPCLGGLPASGLGVIESPTGPGDLPWPEPE